MKKKRVLVVDDDVPLAESLKINLEDTGNFEVAVECQSKNAMQVAREFGPDVILLDVVMPGLDGGDVCDQLAGEPELRDIPVILVTALVSNNEVGIDDGINSGGRIMMAKPIRFKKLLHAIESVLKTRMALI